MSPLDPEAHTSLPDRAETPVSCPTEGALTVLHCVPFQWIMPPLPTAHTSSAAIAATPFSVPTLGTVTVCQFPAHGPTGEPASEAEAGAISAVGAECSISAAPDTQPGPEKMAIPAMIANKRVTARLQIVLKRPLDDNAGIVFLCSWL
jgi:hypothetical protein